MCLGISFTNDCKMEHDRQFCTASAVMHFVRVTVEKTAEPEGKTFDLPVSLHSNLHLTSESQSEIAGISGLNVPLYQMKPFEGDWVSD